MDSTKFPYSKFQTWFAIILLLPLIIFFTYYIIIDSSVNDKWKVLVPFILLISAILGYVCFKFLFPLLRRETILELDKDKLQYFPRNRIIYWKDIQNIDYKDLGHNGYSITFTMIEDVNNIRIWTKFIAGKDEVIIDKIMEYFKKYRSTESTSQTPL